MRNLLIIFFTLFTVLASAQDTKTNFAQTPSPIAFRFAWTNNGLWVDSTVKFTKYKMIGDSVLLGVASDGRLYSITKTQVGLWGGGGAVPTLDAVLVAGNSAPTRTAIVRQLNLSNAGSLVTQLRNSNISGNNIQQMPDQDGTLLNDGSLFSSDGSVIITPDGFGYVDLTMPPSTGIENQNASAQNADFWIDGDGWAKTFRATSANSSFIEIINTNTSATNNPGLLMQVSGQNAAVLLYVPKDATGTGGYPYTFGSRGSAMNIQSPGNMYFVTRATVAGQTDYLFYVDKGAVTPPVDSLVKFDGGGDIYFYHEPAFTAGKDTLLYWNPATGRIERTLVTGGGGITSASNLGGGLDNFDGEVAGDLQFNTFDANFFNLASNVISIDYGGLTSGAFTKFDGTKLVNSILSESGSVLTLNGDMIPNADNSRDLGSATRNWRNTYAINSRISAANLTGNFLTLAANGDPIGMRTPSQVLSDIGANVEHLIVAFSDESTALTTGTAKVTFRIPYAATVTAVRASLTTTSSSGTPTFDINENGTTILSTKITVDVGEKTSTTAVVPPVISDPNIADDSEMTIDIDVAGTGATGGKITIYYTR